MALKRPRWSWYFPKCFVNLSNCRKQIVDIVHVRIHIECIKLNHATGDLEILSNILTAWWRHEMETFSALLALCAGNSPVPVNSSHKGQWRGALMFFLICARINDWVNNRDAGDLRRYRGHYDVIVMGLHLVHRCDTDAPVQKIRTDRKKTFQVLKIGMICHAQDLWKLLRSRKQLRLHERQTHKIYYQILLSLWIPKLQRSLEIHWAR